MPFSPLGCSTPSLSIGAPGCLLLRFPAASMAEHVRGWWSRFASLVLWECVSSPFLCGVTAIICSCGVFFQCVIRVLVPESLHFLLISSCMVCTVCFPPSENSSVTSKLNWLQTKTTSAFFFFFFH